jgi:hypothetical protein
MRTIKTYSKRAPYYNAFMVHSHLGNLLSEVGASRWIREFMVSSDSVSSG